MIKEWIEEYRPSNKEQAEQALREIMQEVALAGLARREVINNKTMAEKIINSNSVSGKLED